MAVVHRESRARKPLAVLNDSDIDSHFSSANRKVLCYLFREYGHIRRSARSPLVSQLDDDLQPSSQSGGKYLAETLHDTFIGKTPTRWAKRYRCPALLSLRGTANWIRKNPMSIDKRDVFFVIERKAVLVFVPHSRDADSWTRPQPRILKANAVPTKSRRPVLLVCTKPYHAFNGLSPASIVRDCHVLVTERNLNSRCTSIKRVVNQFGECRMPREILTVLRKDDVRVWCPDHRCSRFLAHPLP
jgi:hypothetical protein